MGLLKQVVELLLDPRGRISRQDLLLAATLMLVLDMGLANVIAGVPLYVLKALAYWIGGVGIIKRLHDVGQSGWWLLWGAMGMCIWSAFIGLGVGFTVGLDALQPGTIGYVALLAALMLPAMGITLWLHLTPGESVMNRFGPPPRGLMAALLPPARGNSAANEGV